MREDESRRQGTGTGSTVNLEIKDSIPLSRRFTFCWSCSGRPLLSYNVFGS